MCFQTDSNISLVPANCIPICQRPNIKYYLAIAITDTGLIPARAKENEVWYSYKGREIYVRNNFVWVTIPPGFTAKLEKCPSPPVGALQVGYQLDDNGSWVDLFAGVAHTSNGDIIGKVFANGKILYANCGRECSESNFSWIVIRKC